MKYLFFSVVTLLSLGCSPSPKKRVASTCVDKVVTTEKITLLFAGDIMQHQEQIDSASTADGHYDYTDCFSRVKDEIARADIAIANLEVTFAGKPYTGYPSFSAPDEYLFAIRNAGFDLLTTANNHCLDRGKKGIERTILMLDSLNINYVGTYINKGERAKRYPLLIEKNGFRIAFLNYTYATNGVTATVPNIVNYIDRETILKDIEDVRSKKPDVIVACMHWGVEYSLMPDNEQKELADWLLAHGVDHVIGSHPHVVQPMELRRDSITGKKHVVAYSLGNYISNMSAIDTDGGAMLRLSLSKDSIVRVDSCNYCLVWTARPKHTKQKNYIILPINSPKEELPENASNRLRIFTKGARTLLEKHNKEIKEYFF